MPTIEVTGPLHIELRRFKRMCEKADILSRLRTLKFRIKPKDARKRRKLAAVKRQKKRLQKENEICRRERSVF